MAGKVNVSNVTDRIIQKNFEILVAEFNTNPFLKGQWRFFAFHISQTGTSQRIMHSLGFTPKDAIISSVIGGTFSLKYNLFTGLEIFFDATVTDTTVGMDVRMFVGTYSEDGMNV